MAAQLLYLNSYETNPFDNLALEEYLFQNVQPDQVILYLWQNRRTVVIGRNQNAWQECRVEALEQDGGFLARRRSGGGAVYHDMGNLNFTFIAYDTEYDLDRQLDVLLTAVRQLGVEAEKSGRNDITVEGRKISGNAFQSRNGRSCHHGTILIDVNRQDLERYLQVRPEKMQSKGIASVQSRVANLREFAPELTAERMRSLMREAFAEIYGSVPNTLSELSLDSRAIASLSHEFASWDWRLGRPIEFTQELSQRFSWGDIQLHLRVNAGVIEEAAVFSDSLATDFISVLPQILRGIPFATEALHLAIRSLPHSDAQTAQMADDICRLIASSSLNERV